jgi:hypothetical protein
LKRAADENGRSVAETLEIMEQTKARDRADHPREYGGPGAATSVVGGEGLEPPTSSV